MENKLKYKPRKNLKKDSYENLLDGVKIWTEYFRKNPHRFCMEWLGINLYWFQQVLLYMMNICTLFCFIASRGLGKSFLTAIFCCCRAILYPGSRIIVASGNRGQSALVITDKIETLRKQYPALDKEIEKVQKNNDNIRCIFKNGSIIEAIVSGDGARGLRGNVLVCDEFRLIKLDVINSVLKQFLTNPRKPPFLDKPEYEDYPLESNMEIYLSSAYLKVHWSYEKFILALNRMLDDKKAFACSIPYLASLDHKLVLKDKIEEDKEDMGEFVFNMEYGAMWIGKSGNSFFNSSDMMNARVLKNAYYPLTDDEYKNPDERKKRLKQMPKKKDEIRIISADIAVSKANKANQNDNSIFTLWRLLPSGNNLTREIVYMESWNGMKIEKQATRLKRLYTEFKADKIIIDGSGVGFSLVEEMEKSAYDESIDEHYEPFGVYDSNVANNNNFEPLKNGINCIYLMRATQSINNDCAVYLKNAFSSKKIRLLIEENEKRGDFKNDLKYHQDSEYHADMIAPFMQISNFIFETINLDFFTRENGDIVLKEKGRNRKDRYSSVAYGNYLAELIEKEIRRRNRKQTSKFMWFS